MSLAEARCLTLYEYGGLFAEFNHRHKSDKDSPEPPSDALVREQMSLLREMGVRVH